MDGLAGDERCRFRPPKSVQEEGSLLVQSKPKSTQYKDKWAVEVFRTWQAVHEQKLCILDVGSVFKVYDVHCVLSLEEKLKDLDSLSLNYWLTKFVQEVANKERWSLSVSFLVWNCLWLKAVFGGRKWRECTEFFRQQR